MLVASFVGVHEALGIAVAEINISSRSLYLKTTPGFLVDWGLRSPLYPAAAQAAVQAATRALQTSGVLPAGDSVEWIWHDSACDAQKVS